MAKRKPTPRVTRFSMYDPGGDAGQRFKAGTWLESESWTYPSGGFHRRAYAILVPNKYNPMPLPYGQHILVKASIPDTYTSIPARWRYKGRLIRVFLTVKNGTLVAMPEGRG